MYAYYDNQPTNPGLCKRPHSEVFVLPLSEMPCDSARSLETMEGYWIVWRHYIGTVKK